MKSCRPPLFHKRLFEPTVIVTCVRWYLRFSLSLRDVKEMMAQRGLSVDHTSVYRWTQAYGPEVYRRLKGEVKGSPQLGILMRLLCELPGDGCTCFAPSTAAGKPWTFTCRKRGIARPPK